MTILVTGFEPFDGLAENPSQAIVEALARRPTVSHLGQDYGARINADTVTTS